MCSGPGPKLLNLASGIAGESYSVDQFYQFCAQANVQCPDGKESEVLGEARTCLRTQSKTAAEPGLLALGQGFLWTRAAC